MRRNHIHQFDINVQAYSKYRRGYPDQLYSWVIKNTITPQSNYWLDIGCGTGLFHHGLVLANLHIIGLDASYSMLIENNKYSSDQRTHLVLGNGLKLPFKNHSITNASFAMSLHHMKHLDALREASRVCKAEGFIVIVSDNPNKGVWHAELSKRIAIAEKNRKPGFPTTKQLIKLVSEAGLTKIGLKDFPVAIQYSVKDYVKMFREKAFSTSFLFNDEQLDLACNELEEILTSKYLDGDFADITVFTVIIARKMI